MTAEKKDKGFTKSLFISLYKREKLCDRGGKRYQTGGEKNLRTEHLSRHFGQLHYIAGDNAQRQHAQAGKG